MSLENSLSVALQVPGSSTSSLTPLLRKALTHLMKSPKSFPESSRLVGELFGLLLSDKTDSLQVRILLASLVRELSESGKLPLFVPENFSAYSDDKLQVVLPLVRELCSDSRTATRENLEFLVSVLQSERSSVSVKLEALSSVVHLVSLNPSLRKGLEKLDDYVANVIASTEPVNSSRRPGPALQSNLLIKKIRDTVSYRSSCVDSQALELDGTKANEMFTVLLHMDGFFSSEQLIHVGIFSSLYQFLKLRLSKNFAFANQEETLVAPPNSPMSGDIRAFNRWEKPLESAMSSLSSSLTNSVVKVSIRLLQQCQREISSNASILSGKKSWKFINSDVSEPLVGFTRELMESSIVELLKCLDIVSKRDPTVVSALFPHLRRTYERVIILKQNESLGIALCEILRYFLNHSYLVIFDIEPVLTHFFSFHLSRLVSVTSSDNSHCAKRSIIAMEAVVFLLEFAPVLAHIHPGILSKHFPSILRLASWYPRGAGSEISALIPHLIKAGAPLVDLFNTILDLPLITAVSELTFSVEDYVEKPTNNGSSIETSGSDKTIISGGPVSEDPFLNARSAMRLYRSAEFLEIQTYCSRADSDSKSVWAAGAVHQKHNFLLTSLWKGLSLSPRVAAASRLVPDYLSVLLEEVESSQDVEKTGNVFKAILARYGSGNIFLFKSEIGHLLIDFVDKVVNQTLITNHMNEVVTAIVDRVVVPGHGEELVARLVVKIGEVKSKPVPLFYKVLKWLLLLGCNSNNVDVITPDESLEVVYIKQGRVVQRPSDSHPLLDDMITRKIKCDISLQLSCAVITALTKLAVSFPQYRPQTVFLFERMSPDLLQAVRIAESLMLLQSFHLSRDLQTGPCGG